MNQKYFLPVSGKIFLQLFLAWEFQMNAVKLRVAQLIAASDRDDSRKLFSFCFNRGIDRGVGNGGRIHLQENMFTVNFKKSTR